MKEFSLEVDHLKLVLKYLKEQLWQYLSVVWCGVQQTFVDEGTDEWRRHLWTYVHAKGCHFEHLL